MTGSGMRVMTTAQQLPTQVGISNFHDNVKTEIHKVWLDMHFSQVRRTKMEMGWEMPVTTARRMRTHARRTMMAMVLEMLVRK